MFIAYTGQHARVVAQPQPQENKRSQPLAIPMPQKRGDSCAASPASSFAASRANSPTLQAMTPPGISQSPDKRAQALNAQTLMMDVLFQ